VPLTLAHALRMGAHTYLDELLRKFGDEPAEEAANGKPA
jgi:hypothetical protein